MDLFIVFTRYGFTASKCRITQYLPYCSKQESEKGAVMSAENCVIKYKMPHTNL